MKEYHDVMTLSCCGCRGKHFHVAISERDRTVLVRCCRCGDISSAGGVVSVGMYDKIKQKGLQEVDG